MAAYVARDGDTVFYRENDGPNLDELHVRLTLDWALLARQKLALLRLAEGADGRLLEGLVHLIDHIQDTGDSTGKAVVWFTDHPEWDGVESPRTAKGGSI